MKIDKEKLRKLQGLNTCSSNVTFVPSVYDELSKDESMEGLIPSFTCKMLTNGQVEELKNLFVTIASKMQDKEIFDKRDSFVSILEKCIVDWSQLYDIATGEEVPFSVDGVKNLTENVLDSIISELSKYAGFIPR